MTDPVSPSAASGLRVAALYRFTRIDDPAALREPVMEQCRALDICGTLLLAREGLNGTVAGQAEQVERLIGWLRGLPGCAEMDVKYSVATQRPFARMKVKVKREIVTMGVEGVDPARHAGHYVEPRDWNALLERQDVIVIDTRNDYEVEIGTFAGAVNPNIRNFRQFPAWFTQMRDQWEREGKAAPAVAMFCTGGIRCEKSTAFARSLGCEEVYHLKGGILKYLEDIPAQQSLWQGNCFVFDERVSVGQGLALTQDRMCAQCGHPYDPATGHDCAA
ncbi:MAG: rhodanese-related sulfurtransferase [Sphingobium sp.]